MHMRVLCRCAAARSLQHNRCQWHNCQCQPESSLSRHCVAGVIDRSALRTSSLSERHCTGALNTAPYRLICRSGCEVFKPQHGSHAGREVRCASRDHNLGRKLLYLARCIPKPRQYAGSKLYLRPSEFWLSCILYFLFPLLSFFFFSFRFSSFPICCHFISVLGCEIIFLATWGVWWNASLLCVTPQSIASVKADAG